MSEEERADLLANDLIDRGVVPILTKEARDLIASAIREAQASARDDALEEAAVLADASERTSADGSHSQSFSTEPPLSAHIRSLKSKG